MAKRKSAKKNQARGRKTKASVEPMVVKLAEKIGSLLGRARSRADGLVKSVAVRRRVGHIRDGATQLVSRVNRAGAAVKKRVAKPTAVKRSTAPAKRRSKGAVDAQGKRQRKPPVEELFDPLLGEPMGKQMGAKDVRRRGGRG